MSKRSSFLLDNVIELSNHPGRKRNYDEKELKQINILIQRKIPAEQISNAPIIRDVAHLERIKVVRRRGEGLHPIFHRAELYRNAIEEKPPQRESRRVIKTSSSSESQRRAKRSRSLSPFQNIEQAATSVRKEDSRRKEESRGKAESKIKEDSRRREDSRRKEEGREKEENKIKEDSRRREDSRSKEDSRRKEESRNINTPGSSSTSSSNIAAVRQENEEMEQEDRTPFESYSPHVVPVFMQPPVHPMRAVEPHFLGGRMPGPYFLPPRPPPPMPFRPPFRHPHRPPFPPRPRPPFFLR